MNYTIIVHEMLIVNRTRISFHGGCIFYIFTACIYTATMKRNSSTIYNQHLMKDYCLLHTLYFIILTITFYQDQQYM